MNQDLPWAYDRLPSGPLTDPSIKSSELVRVAFEDLKLCRKDGAYSINMNHWHTPLGNGLVCAVCLAGACLAKSHKAPPNFRYLFVGGSDLVTRRLRAIDNARCGDLGATIRLMNGNLTPEVSASVARFHRLAPDPLPSPQDYPQFDAWIEKVIAKLQEHDC